MSYFQNLQSLLSGLINWFQSGLGQSDSGAPGPTVSTDKNDYAPGSTAEITANGFAAGSTVDFTVQIINPGADGVIGTADDTYAAPKEWLATDGGAGDADGVTDGSIRTSLYVDQSYANTSILLSATQATVGDDGSVTKTGPTATEVFTDVPPPPTSSISGYVYVDANNDGIFNGPEAPIPGTTVTLTGTDGFGGAVNQTTTTASDGSYHFTNLLAGGTYTLQETQPAAYLDGKDTVGSEGGTTTNDTFSDINLDAGVDGTDYDFGELLPASLSGFVYADANNNGNKDSGEAPIPGATVTLTGTDNITHTAVNLTTTTDGSGHYEFDNLHDGNYTLTEPEPAGYVDGMDQVGSQLSGTLGHNTSNNNDTISNISLRGGDNGTDNDFGELLPPSIHIEKVTVDGSASGDHLTILAGDSIQWQYTVTNNNGVSLSNVTVTDDQIGAVTHFVSGDTNSNGLLDAGETWVYTASGIAADVAYSNTGTATGSFTDDNGHVFTPSDTDDSGYTGINPGINIVKVTKDGAASGDTLTILAGESIEWDYAVTNTGDVALGGVMVSDSVPAANATIAFVGGDANSNGLLDTTETWTYKATGTATDGVYTNTGTASGISVADTAGHTKPVSDTDDSGYTGINPGINIVKVTKDGSASGDLLTILAGESIEWDYAVTNTGDVALGGVTVSDSVPAANATIAFVGGDANSNGLLDTTEIWTYKATGTAVDGAYSNTGTASGSVTDTAGHPKTVSDTDDSGYTGINPVINIVKVTKDGAASGDTLTILAGESIEWDYAVTNTGDVALGGVTVSDSVPAANATIAFVGGDANSNGLLDTTEIWTYKATGTAVDGSYSNTGTASGSVTDTAGHSKTVSDTDDSGYTGVNPGINIVKVTKDGAASGDTLTILAGESIEWDYAVTNTGDVALSNVTVGDSVGTVHPTFVNGDTNSNNKLDVGETWTYKATGTAVDGSYSNTGTASGSVTDTAGHSKTVSDTDDSGYTGIKPGINIDKVTTYGATSGDNLTIPVGQAIGWKYTVTNTGDVALSGVTVGDSVSGVNPTLISGDANSNSKLDVGETWIYTASGTSISGSYSNTGTASGSVSDTAGHSKTVSDTDTSGYTGKPGEISITKTDGLTYVLPGQAITYTIVASNSGAIDAIGALVQDNFSSLLTNVTWTSTASGGATLNDASGSGNINDTVNLVAGSSITYTVHATVTSSAALQTTANFGAGTNNTNLGQTETINGVTADAFYRSGTSYLTTNTVLWERDQTGDHGLGVWSNGESDPIAGGGDVNELSNEKNAEVIRLTKAGDQSWSSLWVSSLDSGGSGGAEAGTIYWSNSATPDLSTLTTKFSFKYGDFGAGVEEGDVLSLASAASFDPTAKYVFFVAGPNAAGTNNDYLVWKATTTATSLTNTATVTPPAGSDTNPNNNSATDTDTIARPASLAGYVYYDVNNDGTKQGTETGIGGATVKLTGTDDLGHSVNTTMTTAADGSYDFTALRPGTYTITETQPAGYLDGKDAIGSQGGSTGNDVLSNISLGAGVNGVNNNFGELKPTPKLTIVKSVTCVSDTNCDNKTDASDVITYDIKVTNSGTTALTNVIVTDTLPDGTVVTIATIASLTAGQTKDYSKTYTISQADVDTNGNGTGKVTDIATAKDNQGDNVSSSASTTINFTPGIDIEKLVSVDGGVNWYFTAAGYGPNATISQISALTGISSSKLHIGTPSVAVGQQVQFKVLVTNVGDVTDHNVSVKDVGDSSALNANFKFGGSTTIATLAAGAHVISDVIKTTAVYGSHTDVATVSGTYGTGAGAGNLPSASDTETYIGTFTSGNCQATSYWCDAHDNSGCGGSNSNNWSEATYKGQKGILLGDYTGTAWMGGGTANNPKALSSIPPGMLFIADSTATDMLNGRSSSDPRLQVTAAAITAQLNIDNGVDDPGNNPAGGNTVGNDLISEAVRWLTGKGSFTYSDGSTGKIDANTNGILDSAEYSTSTNKFSGTQQTTSGKEWMTAVDPNVAVKSGDIMVSGKDLLAALNAFNANNLQLVTSIAGDMVGWQTSGGVIDIQQNTPTAFWSILKDQGIIAGPLHS